MNAFDRPGADVRAAEASADELDDVEDVLQSVRRAWLSGAGMAGATLVLAFAGRMLGGLVPVPQAAPGDTAWSDRWNHVNATLMICAIPVALFIATTLSATRPTPGRRSDRVSTIAAGELTLYTSLAAATACWSLFLDGGGVVWPAPISAGGALVCSALAAFWAPGSERRLAQLRFLQGSIGRLAGRRDEFRALKKPSRREVRDAWGEVAALAGPLAVVLGLAAAGVLVWACFRDVRADPAGTWPELVVLALGVGALIFAIVRRVAIADPKHRLGEVAPYAVLYALAGVGVVARTAATQSPGSAVGQALLLAVLPFASWCAVKRMKSFIAAVEYRLSEEIEWRTRRCAEHARDADPPRA